LAVIDTRPRNDVGQVDPSQMTELERAVPFPLKLFNPVILKKEGKINYDEGCLSVPGYVEAVPRFKYVEFEATGPDKKKIIIKTDGLLAICIQHEIDHLDGKLFIDRLSTIKRGLIKSKIKKHGFDAEGDDHHESQL
jgi:peptide deformylase